MSVKDALEMAKKHKAEIVDLKFIDVPGLWQHFSIPATELSAEIFEDGLGFDGSSIRGFQSINESDMILIPDPGTAMTVVYEGFGAPGYLRISYAAPLPVVREGAKRIAELVSKRG